jgi:hypothetical protein
VAAAAAIPQGPGAPGGSEHRAGAGGAGRDLYRHVQAEAAVGPAQHALCQALVDERSVEEEGDHGGAVVLGQPLQVHRGHEHESPLRIESALKEDVVEMGIEPHEVSRRGAGDHRSRLDLPARGRAVDALQHAVDKAFCIADEAAIMAEEYLEHLGKVGAGARPRSEDNPAVREAQQEPLVRAAPAEM